MKTSIEVAVPHASSPQLNTTSAPINGYAGPLRSAYSPDATVPTRLPSMKPLKLHA